MKYALIPLLGLHSLFGAETSDQLPQAIQAVVAMCDACLKTVIFDGRVEHCTAYGTFVDREIQRLMFSIACRKRVRRFNEICAELRDGWGVSDRSAYGIELVKRNTFDSRYKDLESGTEAELLESILRRYCIEGVTIHWGEILMENEGERVRLPVRLTVEQGALARLQEMLGLKITGLEDIA